MLFYLSPSDDNKSSQFFLLRYPSRKLSIKRGEGEKPAASSATSIVVDGSKCGGGEGMEGRNKGKRDHY